MMQILSKTWTLFKTNKKYLLLTVLLEILFLASLVQLQFVFFTPTADAEVNNNVH